jgi:trehalose 6-phosphate phosphatase
VRHAAVAEAHRNSSRQQRTSRGWTGLAANVGGKRRKRREGSMTATGARLHGPGTLSAERIALFLDVDGTLLDIAPRPDAVTVSTLLPHDLSAAERTLGGALALISGRPIGELDRLFAPLRLRAGGVHGAEIRRTPDAAIERTVPGQLGSGAWRALNRLLLDFPGSYGENKEASFAVHYREPGTDIERLQNALSVLIERIASTGRPLKLLAGKAVFEIQLCGFDKGRAIERFMQDAPFLGRKPVFIADDESDRPGFEMALALGGMAFSVGLERPGLSGTFGGPEEVRAWLHGFGR